LLRRHNATVMLVALQKCDQETIDELRLIFHTFDKNGNGLLDKNDLVEVTQKSGVLSEQRHHRINEAEVFADDVI
jgi:Ca2+-binding EF-hand superfamily protein